MARFLIPMVLGLAMMLVAALFEVNYLNYASPISWSEKGKITFADFRGIKRPGYDPFRGHGLATVHSDIQLQVLSQEEVEVVARFHPSRSFASNRKWFDPYLLEHEMLHFQITEYHARLLRERISRQGSPLYPAWLHTQKELILIREKDMQRRYDRETDHSTRTGPQKTWQERMDSLLLDLDAYAPERVLLQH